MTGDIPEPKNQLFPRPKSGVLFERREGDDAEKTNKLIGEKQRK